MSRSPRLPSTPPVPQRLAQAPGKLWSARHSQHGCQDAREAGAAPPAPRGAAPTPNEHVTFSMVVVGSRPASSLSRAPASAMAMLDTFEGQAVFRIVDPGSSDFRAGELLRLRKGSRLHAPRKVPT